MSELSASEEDYRKLYNYCVGFAKQMLADKQAFYPFGAAINVGGSLEAAGANTGEEHPTPTALLEILTSAFSKEAAAGTIRACCVCFDGRWQPAEGAEKTDAIMCVMEHRDHITMRFIVPYSVAAGTSVTLEEPVTQRLVAKNFPWR